MKVMELLDEIIEIIDTASGMPLSSKIIVDAKELREIVDEIRADLPEEIQQARWIKNERDRILEEAKSKYDSVLSMAKRQAEELVETHTITAQANKRAADLMNTTQNNIRQLKMSTYDYVDGILFDFQEKMEELSEVYFNDMFKRLETTFNEVNVTLATNREEIKEMAYKTSMNLDETSAVISRMEELPPAEEQQTYEENEEDDWE